MSAVTSESVALFIVGVIQPFLQEAIVRNRLSDAKAHWLTVGLSAAVALVASWLTGGFAEGKVPAFSFADPSPLLGFLLGKIAPVYALSQVIWGAFKTGIHSLARTVAPAGEAGARAA